MSKRLDSSPFIVEVDGLINKIV